MNFIKNILYNKKRLKELNFNTIEFKPKPMYVSPYSFNQEPTYFIATYKTIYNDLYICSLHESLLHTGRYIVDIYKKNDKYLIGNGMVIDYKVFYNTWQPRVKKQALKFFKKVIFPHIENDITLNKFKILD